MSVCDWTDERRFCCWQFPLQFGVFYLSSNTIWLDTNSTVNTGMSSLKAGMWHIWLVDWFLWLNKEWMSRKKKGKSKSVCMLIDLLGGDQQPTAKSKTVRQLWDKLYWLDMRVLNIAWLLEQTRAQLLSAKQNPSQLPAPCSDCYSCFQWTLISH